MFSRAALYFPLRRLDGYAFGFEYLDFLAETKPLGWPLSKPLAVQQENATSSKNVNLRHGFERGLMVLNPPSPSAS